MTFRSAPSSVALLRGIALALALAALVAGQPPAAQACGTRVDLAAIEAAMADPGLDPALLREARDLKGKAAKAIEDGHAAEGNGHYRQLMSLLQLNKPSSLKRC
jgi:hypothetical protein